MPGFSALTLPLAPFGREAAHVALEAGGEVGRAVEADEVTDYGNGIAAVLEQAAGLLETYATDEVEGGLACESLQLKMQIRA